MKQRQDSHIGYGAWSTGEITEEIVNAYLEQAESDRMIQGISSWSDTLRACASRFVYVYRNLIDKASCRYLVGHEGEVEGFSG